MTLRLLLFIFSAHLLSIVDAQDKGDETLKWSSSKKLSWNDYKASPDPSSTAAASTATHLGLSYSVKNSAFDFTVTSLFSQTKSWGRHKTAHILAHEQGHFDIAEVHARKLYQSLLAYSFNPKSFKKDLDKIYKKALLEKEKMQQLYDQETNHSINTEKQTEWLVKIEQLLKETEDYKAY